MPSCPTFPPTPRLTRPQPGGGSNAPHASPPAPAPSSRSVPPRACPRPTSPCGDGDSPRPLRRRPPPRNSSSPSSAGWKGGRADRPAHHRDRRVTLPTFIRLEPAIGEPNRTAPRRCDSRYRHSWTAPPGQVSEAGASGVVAGARRRSAAARRRCRRGRSGRCGGSGFVHRRVNPQPEVHRFSTTFPCPRRCAAARRARSGRRCRGAFPGGGRRRGASSRPRAG